MTQKTKDNNCTNNHINILSWNIQSSNCYEGNKFDDPQFCSIINPFPIVCLQETRQTLKYPGYRSFNVNRQDNRHGGVCIIVRNNLSNGVKQYKTSLQDVVVCKFEKHFFKLENDMFIESLSTPTLSLPTLLVP